MEVPRGNVVLYKFVTVICFCLVGVFIVDPVVMAGPKFLVAGKSAATLYQQACLSAFAPAGIVHVAYYAVLGYLFAMARSMSRELRMSQENNADLASIIDQKKAELTIAQQISVETLVKLTKLKDKETGSHLYRIKYYVHLLAQELKNGSAYSAYLQSRPRYVEDVSLASLLHDIGKAATPQSILNKAGRLSNDEFEIVKSHTVLASKILRQASRDLSEEIHGVCCMALAGDIAHFHHEHWDGLGYPDGRQGADIPLSARIVAVADVYDALTSPRPYKQPWTHAEAVEEIAAQSGKQFDPVVVRAFMAIEDRIREVNKQNTNNAALSI